MKYAVATIATIAALAFGCKSEQEKKHDALRDEVMALAAQTPIARQHRACRALDQGNLFAGEDDPQHIACAILVPAGQQVYFDSLVDEKPRLLSLPPLRYPAELRRAKIEGHAVVRVIVDATGRVEPNHIKVIRSDNPAFDRPAIDMMLAARFKPGFVINQPMRVLLDRTVEFRLPR